MSQELLQRELEVLRQRVFQLEKALSESDSTATLDYPPACRCSSLLTASIDAFPSDDSSSQGIDQVQPQSRTEQFLQSVIDAMPVAVLVKDAQNLRFVLWNRAAEMLFQLQAEVTLGRTDYDLFSPEQAAASVRHDRQVLASPCSLLIPKEPILMASGDRYFQIRKTVIRDAQAQPEYLLVLCEDVTDRHTHLTQLERNNTQLTQALQHLQHNQAQLIQTEKMVSLSQLVAGVAHEINNPINFIVGNLKYAERYTQELLNLVQCYRHHYPESLPEVQVLLEDLDLDFLLEDMLKLHSSMKAGADRICQVVQSLRTFARLDESEYKSIEVHGGLESTLLLLHNRLKAQANRPAIALLKDYGELPEIECYAGELNQVFMNLLSNAIDAIEEKLGRAEMGYQPQIRIRTSLESNDQDDRQIQIRITDNGCGMTEAIREQIFTPFFTTKPLGKGSGIGLSISHQIITERHQGTIDCVSIPDQGSEFILTLPLLGTG